MAAFGWKSIAAVSEGWDSNGKWPRLLSQPFLAEWLLKSPEKVLLFPRPSSQIVLLTNKGGLMNEYYSPYCGCKMKELTEFMYNK